jgi:hypothetical protein
LAEGGVIMKPNIVRMILAVAASSLLLTGLASCGGASEEDDASGLPSQAELHSLQGEGLLQAAREASKYELWAHYRLMQATGMEEALGGEEQAVAALIAVSAAFERSATAAQSDVPRLIPASFDGTGLDAGVMGVGYGLVGGGMSAGMLGGLSDKDVTDMAKAGPLSSSHADGSASLEITQAGVNTTIEQTVDASGVTGTVKTRVHLDACPDADGKLTVTIDTESRMSGGGKGGTVKVSYRRERWLDDDANIITADAAEDFQIEMSGEGSTANQLSFAEHYTVSRAGQASGEVTRQQGFDIFHLDDAKHTEQLRTDTQRLMSLMADAMLMGMGQDPPYEAGRCVDLQVGSNPAKRSGAKPNTAYTLTANPRAKLDGTPTRGTVTATLDGESTLNPTTKVRADAQFDYANPSKKDKIASVAFEARSRRGVGRASLDFDTRAGGYRISGGQNDFQANTVVCSVTGPFDIRSSVGIVMHMSGGDGGGSFTISGKAAGVVWSGGGRYTLALGDGGSGTLKANGTAAIASPMGRFSDSVEPTFSVTPVTEECASG